MAKIRVMAVLPPVIFAGLAALFFVGMDREGQGELPSARVGQEVPPLTATPLGSLPTFDVASLADGQVKMVNFWASWCAPCRAEHPTLTELAQKGVPVYGINYGDTDPKALEFLAELGNPYTAVVADPQRRTGIDWGLYGVPETYLVDGEGKIVHRIAGPLTQRVLADRLAPELAKLGVTLGG